MRRTAETHDRITRELNEERVAALRRISQTLESLIAQLQHVRESVSTADERERLRAVSAYRELRARAVQYRWYLEVQREALGFRQHRLLDDFYVIPGPIDA